MTPRILTLRTAGPSPVIGLLVALAATCAPVLVNALALGDIRTESALNEPLVAEIEIESATAEELAGLEIGLPPRETFSRYGIDRPELLSGLRFRVATGAAGAPVLRVTSIEPVREPFLTFLVEARWARGRLLREYTVLLDPPVYLPGQPSESAPPAVAAPAPLAPPPVAPAPAAPEAVRPTPARAPAPAAKSPVRPAAAALAGTDYGPVRRGETLWSIAERARRGTDLTISQMMVSIYSGNQAAFHGNMSRLKQGVVLRIPERSEAAAVDAGQAYTEFRRHDAAWRAGGGQVAGSGVAAAASEPPGALRLVAPGTEAAETDAGTAARLAAQQAENDSLRSELETVRGELDETRRLLDVRDAELADVQQRLTDLADQSESPAEPAAESTAAGVDLEVATGDEQQAEAPVADVDTSPEEPGTIPAETPPAGEPAEAPAPAVATRPVADAPAVAPPAPGLGARVSDFLGGLVSNTWLWLGLGGALLIGLLGTAATVVKRRREAEASETWEELTREVEVDRDAITQEAPLVARDSDEEPSRIVVEESMSEEVTAQLEPVQPVSAEAPERAEPVVSASDTVEFPFDDTISGQGDLSLDQSDPLAEADFHMAYGLYDQAAELVQSAVAVEPQRRDLRMKLLEIFFVWGNKDAFLESARDLHASMADGPDSDWDKILILGKQICPEDPLFAGETSGAVAGEGAIDLELTGSIDVGIVPDLDAGEPLTESVVDLDISQALAADFGEETGAESVIDLPFESSELDALSPPAGPPARDETSELEVDDLGIDLDLEALAAVPASGDTAPLESGVGSGADIAGDEALDMFAAAGEGEIEGLVDFDLGDAAAEEGLSEEGLSEEGLSEAEIEAAESPTETLAASGIDFDLDEIMAAHAQTDADDAAQFAGTQESPTVDVETGELAQAPVDTDASAQTDVLDELTPEADLGDLDATGSSELPIAGLEGLAGETDTAGPGEVQGTLETEPDFTIDIDFEALAEETDVAAEEPVGGGPEDWAAVASGVIDDQEAMLVAGETESHDEAEDVTRYAPIDMDAFKANAADAASSTVELPEVDMLPAEPDADEINEVGTKLDLARAYLDMGDPDGARSILEEVLDEGDTSQKQEARQLMGALS